MNAGPSTLSPTLLAIDDEKPVLHLIARFSERLGFTVVTSSDSRTTLNNLHTIKPDAVMVDLRMPHVNGLAVLKAIRDADPACQVILMTGQATVESAIEAVKLGALDYLTKPFDFDRLRDVLTTVRRGLERRGEMLAADGEAARTSKFHGIIGRSPAMQGLFDTIRRLAPHVRAALIVGETGTGKELVARALHYVGPRRDRPFLALNCSAIVEGLFESEVFGHVRGAFTGAIETKAGIFEHADGGTVFLDEVGELPLPLQAKLLRVVEYGEVQRVGTVERRQVDVRLLAATNRDLRDEVRSGRFREDLFYRLNVVEIVVPPLRDRRSDIPYLTAAFIREFASQFGKPIAGVSASAENLLLTAAWPGNVRELRNTLERACMMSDGRILTERELGGLPSGTAGRTPLRVEDEPRVVATALSREDIEQALERTRGNKAAAARDLGISRRSFYRRIEALGL